MKCIKFVDVFSERPYGTNDSHGNFNAERFKRDILIPEIEKGEPFLIDLDGTNRYSSSFLHHAFGTLKEDGFTQNQLNLIHIKHSLPSYELEINSYIRGY